MFLLRGVNDNEFEEFENCETSLNLNKLVNKEYDFLMDVFSEKIDFHL